eukprot:scaffold1030_cov174-Pinguiococcus_pyrenoidosus.AAC.1
MHISRRSTTRLHEAHSRPLAHASPRGASLLYIYYTASLLLLRSSCSRDFSTVRLPNSKPTLSSSIILLSIRSYDLRARSPVGEKITTLVNQITVAVAYGSKEHQHEGKLSSRFTRRFSPRCTAHGTPAGASRR